MVRVLVDERRLARVGEAQKGRITRVGGYTGSACARAKRAPSGPVPIDVLAERGGHKQIDGIARQKAVRDLQISLRAQVRALGRPDIEDDAADRIFPAGPVLITPERCNLIIA